LTGFSGNVMSLYSGVNSNTTSVTVNFANNTPYVGFLWGVQFTSQNSMLVNITLADNSVVTLRNCGDTSNVQCMARYVDQNWWNNVYNFLLGWLLGDVVRYYSVYVQYQPDNGVKIKSIQFVVSKCANCGFLSADTAQDFKVDKITYVDGAVAPDHLEVTTSSSSVSQGANTTYTIKACGDASCSLPYINGVTGSLSLSGAGLTATYPSGAAFTIPAGPTNTTTVTASLTPAGTATVALTGYSPTPTNSTKVYCGLGVAASSSASCSLTVLGLHHLEVTTGASAGDMNAAVTYTVKACSNAACSVTYTGGVSGTLGVSGTSVTPSASQAFAISAGTSSTSVSFTPTAAGTLTASVSGVSPAPAGSPTVYCGIGATAASGNSCGFTVQQTLDHVELTTSSATNVTCTPLSYTVKACGNAACSTLYTRGLSGTLTVSGVTVNYPAGQSFTIGSGASSTTMSVHATTVGTATAALSGLSVTPVGSPQVYCGMGAAASSGGSCAVTMADSALLFSVPNHVSEVAQTVTVSAVRSSNNATVCTPAFTTAKNVTFKCSYGNPATGTLPVRVGGTPVNASGSAAAACDATGRAVSLSFNASGVASTTVQYADVGQVTLNATYTGSGSDAGLVMNGSSTFVAVPASFAFSNVTASPVAGSTFSAKLSALNSAGAAVPNFGKETPTVTDYVRLSWAKYRPTGTTAVSGTFTGTGIGGAPYISSTSFANGAVTLSDLKWSEVGTGDLGAALVGGSYLGTGTSVSGSTSSGGVGPFVPHHFDVSVTPGCSGAFTYSGQPFSVSVTARNASGAQTQNYDGTGNTSPNFARSGSFSAVGAGAATGSLSSTSISASQFVNGVGTVSASPVFSFTNKLTTATTVSIRATDSDGVTSASTSGGTDGSLLVRSGRIKVSNAFGSEKSSLEVPVQSQFWNGRAWVVNSQDSCTSIPAAAVARSNYLDSKGASTGAWTTTPTSVTISGGNGKLYLSAPTGGGTGSVDFAFNLGSGSADQSCLTSHPATTGAGVPWLRSQNGSTGACAGITTYDRDPSARASFGVYQPETRKAVYQRELY
jgi:MSHA biogenesis protein MshQ